MCSPDELTCSQIQFTFLITCHDEPPHIMNHMNVSFETRLRSSNHSHIFLQQALLTQFQSEPPPHKAVPLRFILMMCAPLMYHKSLHDHAYCIFHMQVLNKQNMIDFSRYKNKQETKYHAYCIFHMQILNKQDRIDFRRYKNQQMTTYHVYCIFHMYVQHKQNMIYLSRHKNHLETKSYESDK